MVEIRAKLEIGLIGYRYQQIIVYTLSVFGILAKFHIGTSPTYRLLLLDLCILQVSIQHTQLIFPTFHLLRPGRQFKVYSADAKRDQPDGHQSLLPQAQNHEACYFLGSVHEGHRDGQW